MKFLIKLNICFKLIFEFIYTRSGIEEVITSATRNRVAVRHVGSNPTRSATEHLIQVLFFFAKIPSKSRYIRGNNLQVG